MNTLSPLFKVSLLSLIALLQSFSLSAQSESSNRPVDLVNLFVGTSNYGTTNPGAMLPNGLMNISPFNVAAGEGLNKFEKDKTWWSTPYTSANNYFTGFSQVNLSGVGCPDLAGLVLMPTMGALDVDYRSYGSELSNQRAKPGYYAAHIEKYGIDVEVSATTRSSVAAFKFPKGKAHILLNLSLALSNETGAELRFLNDSTLIGSKLMGNFCYNPQAVYRQYFAMRLSKSPDSSGYWKQQPRSQGPEANWNPDDGKLKIYHSYRGPMSGDEIGAWFSYNEAPSQEIEVYTAVSFVSAENALLNLETELAPYWQDDSTPALPRVAKAAESLWNEALSVVDVQGGTDDQKRVFYTALYHLLVHPNILQDVNGEYPEMESHKIGRLEQGNRYTVFSLWDTYRNVHPLLTLFYPEKQLDMIHTLLAMYEEGGWLPRWELYGRETLTMQGDPSLIVINDTWQKGLRQFDVQLALQAMLKGANSKGAKNRLRPDNDDYLSYGYIPLREQYDNSVSNALEYFIADWNLGQFAASIGDEATAKMMHRRSLGYKHYYSPKYKLLRPRLPNKEFLEPFDPKLGANFEPSPGFHEGNAWNYSFFVPHDIGGLARLMGGETTFVKQLDRVFEYGYYDPSNEPDLAYPFLYTYFPRYAWRTQELTQQLLDKHYRNRPDGLPGNDDTGTLSAWAIFSMMGFYPDCPGLPEYALTSPVFDRICIKLDRRYYPKAALRIHVQRKSPSDKYIQRIEIGDQRRQLKGYRISHQELLNAGDIYITLGPKAAL